MVIKKRNIGIFFIIILSVIICLFIHLIYGNCQTTKWHYIFQRYYVPDFFPSYLLINDLYPEVGRGVYKNHTGEWNTWFENGNIYSKSFFNNGKGDGEYIRWYENGKLDYVGTYINDVEDGMHRHWYENGNRKFEKIFENGKLISFDFWYKDGTYKE